MGEPIKLGSQHVFLYKSAIFRLCAVAFAVASCNEAKFNSDRIPSKSAPLSTKSERELEPARRVEPPVDLPGEPPLEFPAELPDEPPAELPVELPPELPVEPTPEPSPVDPPVPIKPPFIRRETVTIEEAFTQEGLAGTADIAIVIDDSGSMDKEQQNLSTKLNDLLVALQDTNWQIAVITTSPKVENGRDICQLKLIKSTDADMERKFKEAVTPGINGSGEEQGVRQAVNALKCTEFPWVRPASTVAVLFVSDEDNCSSDGIDCGSHPWAKEGYLIDYVEKDLGRVVGKNAGFYGIIAPSGEICDTAKNKSVQYERLIHYKSNGNVNYGNICDQSYKGTLERISKNIAKLLSSAFVIKQMPDIGSLMITGIKANGDAIHADDYKIAGTTVSFKIGSEPALGSQIVLTYKVTTETLEN